MKKAVRFFSLMTALAMIISFRFPVLAAEREAYTYTVTFSAGTQGTISSDGISVDGGGNYEIACDGRNVTIRGLTAENHVRFLNSAVSLGEDSKYYVRGVRVGGRDNSTVDLAYFPVERDQDYVVAYGIKGDMVQYTVHYQDSAGNELYPPQVYYGNVGDKPVVAYLYVEGYQPQAYNLTRTLQEDAARNVFTFVYTPIPTVTVTRPGAGGNATPAPGNQEPAVSAAPAGPQGPAPEVPAPGQEDVPEGPDGAQPDENVPDIPGIPEDDTPDAPDDVNIPDEETPQNQGPENIQDLDEEETPLGAFPPGDEGTVAASNRAKTRSAILAGGIGLIAVIAIAAGVYGYRRMRKAGQKKADE